MSSSTINKWGFQKCVLCKVFIFLLSSFFRTQDLFGWQYNEMIIQKIQGYSTRLQQWRQPILILVQYSVKQGDYQLIKLLPTEECEKSFRFLTPSPPLDEGCTEASGSGRCCCCWAPPFPPADAGFDKNTLRLAFISSNWTTSFSSSTICFLKSISFCN